MPEFSDYKMPDQDLIDFEKLTKQESHSIEGQILKMGMVETMIRDRFEALRRSLEVELRTLGLKGEAFDKQLDNRLQNIRISRMLLGDGRFNLIVEKGDDDYENEDPSIYRVMIPQHIDTVNSGAPLEFVLQPSNPDHVSGLGVDDMGAAVLNSIDLAISTKIPKGIKAYFVFTVDEEKDSIGALDITNQWDIWPLINAVLSSEIGPVPPLPDDDKRIRLIIARTGRLKMIGDISIDPRAQGHGSMRNMPNASTALRHLLNHLEQRFYEGYSLGHDQHEERQKRTHDLLGEEMIEDGNLRAWKSREGYFPVDRAEFDFAVRMVPPSTQDEYRDKFLLWTKEFARRGKWSKWGIAYSITRNSNVASYSPYELEKNDPIVQVASAVIQKVSGIAPDIVGASSVADECYYAEKPVISIPPNGDMAHHPDEWVSLSSMMKVRAVLKMLLEDTDGFSSLQKQVNQDSK